MNALRFVKEWGLAPPTIVAVAIVIAAIMAWQVTASRLDSIERKVDMNIEALTNIEGKLDDIIAYETRRNR